MSLDRIPDNVAPPTNISGRGASFFIICMHFFAKGIAYHNITNETPPFIGIRTKSNIIVSFRTLLALNKKILKNLKAKHT